MSIGYKPATHESLTGKYIVWSPESPLAPKMVYTDRPQAIRVSIYMSNKNKGQRFYVAKLVGVSEAVTPRVAYKGIEE